MAVELETTESRLVLRDVPDNGKFALGLIRVRAILPPSRRLKYGSLVLHVESSLPRQLCFQEYNPNLKLAQHWTHDDRLNRMHIVSEVKLKADGTWKDLIVRFAPSLITQDGFQPSLPNLDEKTSICTTRSFKGMIQMELTGSMKERTSLFDSHALSGDHPIETLASLSLPFEASVCNSRVTIDTQELSFGDTSVSTSYFREFMISNASEISTCVLLYFETEDVFTDCFEFVEYDTGNSLQIVMGSQGVKIAPLSSVRVRVNLKFIASFTSLIANVENFKSLLFKRRLVVQNLLNSFDDKIISLSATIVSESGSESGAIIPIDCDPFELDFGDCYSGVTHYHHLSLKNSSIDAIDVKFVSDLPGQVFFYLADVVSSAGSESPPAIERINSIGSPPDDSSILSSDSVASSAPESKMQDRVEEVTLPSARSRSFTVAFCPEIPRDLSDEEMNIRFRGLIPQKFTISLKSLKGASAGLKIIKCRAKVCTSFISLSKNLLQLGDCIVGIPRHETIKVSNLSALPTSVEVRLKSSNVSVSDRLLNLGPRESVNLTITFLSSSVNPDYRKQITFVNLRNSADEKTLVVKANSMDVQGPAMHSLFYKIVIKNSSASNPLLNFGRTVVNSPVIRSMTFVNVTNATISVQFKSQDPTCLEFFCLENDQFDSDARKMDKTVSSSKLSTLSKISSDSSLVDDDKSRPYTDEPQGRLSRKTSSTPREELYGALKLLSSSFTSVDPLAESADVINFINAKDRLQKAIKEGELYSVSDLVLGPLQKQKLHVRFVASESFCFDGASQGKLKYWNTAIDVRLSVISAQSGSFLPSNLSDMPTREVSVCAKVCKSVMKIVQPHLNFGRLSSMQPQSRTITIFNRSDVSLAYIIQKTGSIASDDLIFSEGAGEIGVIPPLGQREIPFQFRPSLAGQFYEALSVVNVQDNMNNQLISVRADLRKPVNFWIRHMDVNFGSCLVDAKSAPQKIFVKNISARKRTFKLKCDFPILPMHSRPILLFQLGKFFSGSDEKDSGDQREEEKEYLERKLRIAIRKNKMDKIQSIQKRLEELKTVTADNDSAETDVFRDRVQFENQVLFSLASNAVQCVLVSALLKHSNSSSGIRNFPAELFEGGILVYEQNNKDYIREITIRMNIFYDKDLYIKSQLGSLGLPSLLGDVQERSHSRDLSKSPSPSADSTEGKTTPPSPSSKRSVDSFDHDICTVSIPPEFSFTLDSACSELSCYSELDNSSILKLEVASLWLLEKATRVPKSFFIVHSRSETQLSVKISWKSLTALKSARLGFSGSYFLSDIEFDSMSITVDPLGHTKVFVILKKEPLADPAALSSPVVLGKITVFVKCEQQSHESSMFVVACPDRSPLSPSPSRVLGAIQKPTDSRTRFRESVGDNSAYFSGDFVIVNKSSSSSWFRMSLIDEKNVLGSYVVVSRNCPESKAIELPSSSFMVHGGEKLTFQVSWRTSVGGNHTVFLRVHDLLLDSVFKLPITWYVPSSALVDFPEVKFESKFDFGTFIAQTYKTPDELSFISNRVVPVKVTNLMASDYLVSVRPNLPSQVQVYADQGLRLSARRLLLLKKRTLTLYVHFRLRLPERFHSLFDPFFLEGGLIFVIRRMNAPNSKPLQISLKPFKACLSRSVLFVENLDGSPLSSWDCGTSTAVGSIFKHEFMIRNPSSIISSTYKIHLSKGVQILSRVPLSGKIEPHQFVKVTVQIRSEQYGFVQEKVAVENLSDSGMVHEVLFRAYVDGKVCIAELPSTADGRFLLDFGAISLNGHLYDGMKLVSSSSEAPRRLVNLRSFVKKQISLSAFSSLKDFKLHLPKTVESSEQKCATPFDGFALCSSSFIISPDSAVGVHFDLSDCLTSSLLNSTELEKLFLGKLVPISGIVLFYENSRFHRAVSIIDMKIQLCVTLGKITHRSCDVGELDQSAEAIIKRNVCITNLSELPLLISRDQTSIIPQLSLEGHDIDAIFQISPRQTIEITAQLSPSEIPVGVFSFVLKFVNLQNPFNNEDLTVNFYGQKVGTPISFSRLSPEDTLVLPEFVIPLLSDDYCPEEWFSISNAVSDEHLLVSLHFDIDPRFSAFLRLSALSRSSNKEVSELVLTFDDPQEIKIRGEISSLPNLVEKLRSPIPRTKIGSLRLKCSGFPDEIVWIEASFRARRGLSVSVSDIQFEFKDSREDISEKVTVSNMDPFAPISFRTLFSSLDSIPASGLDVTPAFGTLNVGQNLDLVISCNLLKVDSSSFSGSLVIVDDSERVYSIPISGIVSQRRSKTLKDLLSAPKVESSFDDSKLCIRGATLMAGTTNSFIVNLGQRDLDSPTVEWEIRIENIGNVSSSFCVTDLGHDGGDHTSWLELSCCSGILEKFGSFQTVQLKALTSSMGVFSSYLLIENLNNPSDVFVCRVEIEIVAPGSHFDSAEGKEDIFEVCLDNSQGESSLIDLGEVYYTHIYRHRSFVLKNLSESNLDFVLTSDLDPHSSSSLYFSLSTTTLKLFNSLTVLPGHSVRIFIHFQPMLELLELQSSVPREEISNSFNLKISTVYSGSVFDFVDVNCRLIRDYQKTINFSAVARCPQIKISHSELVFTGRAMKSSGDAKTGAPVFRIKKDQEELIVSNLFHRDLEIVVRNDSLFFITSLPAELPLIRSKESFKLMVSLNIENLYQNRDMVLKDKYIEEHVSVYNKNNWNERYTIALRFTTGKLKLFYLAPGTKKAYPFTRLEESVVNLITNLHGLCFRLDPEGPSKSLISKSYLDIKFDYLYVTDELIFYALKGYVGHFSFQLAHLLYQVVLSDKGIGQWCTKWSLYADEVKAVILKEIAFWVSRLKLFLNHFPSRKNDTVASLRDLLIEFDEQQVLLTKTSSPNSSLT